MRVTALLLGEDISEDILKGLDVVWHLSRNGGISMMFYMQLLKDFLNVIMIE